MKIKKNPDVKSIITLAPDSHGASSGEKMRRVLRMVLVLPLMGGVLSCRTAERHWFVVNEDNDHFFKCDASLMTEKALADYIDYIARGKVTHLFMCVAGQRTSYDSKTWEPIWAGLDEPAREDTAMCADGTRDRWAVNCKLLQEKGIDPYAVWIRRCREKGVSPWLSLRMNDIHYVEITNYFRNTTFYRTRTDLRIDPSGRRGGAYRSLDYAHKEVRDYTMAQVREIAERWDADGLELDWMRFGHVFNPDCARTNAPILDAFVREASAAIRSAGERRGRKAGLAVRVPPDPDLALSNGYDVVKWAREGWVDVVIADSFYFADASMPVDKWLKLLNGTKARFVPSLGSDMPDKTPVGYVEGCRGLARRFYDQGATGVYVFNLPYRSNVTYSTDGGGSDENDMAARLYEEGLGPDDIAGRPFSQPPVVHDYPLISSSRAR